MPVKMLTTPVPAIPVGVPSQLLQRRPDIAAAERTMAEANAMIGVATAAYYPTLSLTGGGGLQSSVISKLFSAAGVVLVAGGLGLANDVRCRAARATVAQYSATYNADVAAYKQTVLTAFQQVEDYIATLRVTSEQILAPACGRGCGAELSGNRHGAISDRVSILISNVITAQTTLLADQQTEVTLRVNEMTAAVQLIQALGGGWDATQLPSPADVSTTPTASQLSNKR